MLSNSRVHQLFHKYTTKNMLKYIILTIFTLSIVTHGFARRCYVTDTRALVNGSPNPHTLQDCARYISNRVQGNRGLKYRINCATTTIHGIPEINGMKIKMCVRAGGCSHANIAIKNELRGQWFAEYITNVYCNECPEDGCNRWQ